MHGERVDLSDRFLVKLVAVWVVVVLLAATGGVCRADPARDNDAPVAADNTVAVKEDAAGRPLGLTAPTDSEDADATLSIAVVAAPSREQGNVTYRNDGRAVIVQAGDALLPFQLEELAFTPAPNYDGLVDDFVYAVTDAKGRSAEGRVAFVITPVNDAPVADHVEVTVAQGRVDAPLKAASPTDTEDVDATLKITVTSTPATHQGVVTFRAGQALVAVRVGDSLTPDQLSGLVFTPTGNFIGKADDLAYTVTDRDGATAMGAVVIHISASADPVSASIPEPVAQPLEADGPAYPVGEFVLSYQRPKSGQPTIEELLQTPVTLGHTAKGFVAPRPGVPLVTRPIVALNALGEQTYYASAVQRLLEAVRDALSARHMLGIYVEPDSLQIDSRGEDLRPAGSVAMNILIATGVVTEVRSLAQGKRIAPEERIDHPLHERVRRRSPVRVHREGEAVRSELIRQDLLNDYVMRLSRHPGRRVDMAVSPSAEAGGVTLDYLITETKPWLVYAQLSNTGTRNTSRLREQFGFRDYQLTNNDDVLSVDYTTSNFDEAHAVRAEYDAPLFGSDRVRWRVYGGWSRYTASDVGINDDDFSGRSTNFGGDLMLNIFQSGPLFVDVGGGWRYERIKVSDTLPGSRPGANDFLIPYVVLRTERNTDWSSMQGSVTLEWQSADINGVNTRGLDDLGRPSVDEDWAILRWNLTQSVFLEPLLNRSAWENPVTPESSTLAHELLIQVRGQHSFDRRVIPQHEMVAGGLYTVRGHPQSIVAGDTAVISTAEYRFHIPKALPLEPEPRRLFGEDFRFAPQQVYSPTDWDLILRGFVDVGYTVSDAAAGIPEESRTLVGTGLGVELQYKRNLTFRLDWGVAMNPISGLVGSKSNRVHFVLTLLH